MYQFNEPQIPTRVHKHTGTNIQYPGHGTGALYTQLFAEKGLGMEALRNASQGDYTLGGDYRKLVGEWGSWM